MYSKKGQTKKKEQTNRNIITQCIVDDETYFVSFKDGVVPCKPSPFSTKARSREHIYLYIYGKEKICVKKMYVQNVTKKIYIFTLEVGGGWFRFQIIAT